MSEVILREIQKADNVSVAKVIRSVLEEFNVPKVGTAYADPQLDCMFETYSEPNSVYFVVEKEGRIIGGAGIAPLANGSPKVCELQKMYFLPETRGLGIGARMMELCLQKAKAFGFEQCYLETMPYMEAAQKLYVKSGFTYLEQPMGCTGHSSCPVWMLKLLE
ncbi:GNAT family N-acetyltransferase [Flavobacterium suncheonense]|uniref:Acetyltransferase n=1 Tax=Flavobacterium suncheonense GH29-5 = DSM 17707 TaxID=1121899 RepID=A0A0A2MAC7_9FLAO|nr:GNAT family N-acetyltransferase [Flavobacterium suncheonense]KGO89622.1 acetyltransferase [Flavobacterium suncheonense GH29-5 = DSM 17707]